MLPGDEFNLSSSVMLADECSPIFCSVFDYRDVIVIVMKCNENGTEMLLKIVMKCC
jgi:hypothetical protein